MRIDALSALLPSTFDDASERLRPSGIVLRIDNLSASPTPQQCRRIPPPASLEFLRRPPPIKNYPHPSFTGNERTRMDTRGDAQDARRAMVLAREESPRLPPAAYGDLAGTAGERRHAIAGMK